MIDDAPRNRSFDPPAGMDREVGFLFAQLEMARRQTRDAIAGLSTEDLDRAIPGCQNTIGQLVFHVAGAEYYWVHRVAVPERTDDRVRVELAPALLGSSEGHALHGHDVAFYLAKLDEVRASTEAVCWKLKDADLDAEHEVPHDGTRASVRYVLAHLADHEAHHRGQIELLRSALERTRTHDRTGTDDCTETLDRERFPSPSRTPPRGPEPR